MRSIITISREFGSGGREIGKKLADDLGIPFYDKELLEMASKESGICQELFVKNDESYTNSFLFSLVMGNYPVSADGRINPDMPLNHKIFLAQFETIKNIAKKGPCVIVGRCADYVLKNEPNVIDFFISGNTAEKKKRILERYDIEKNKAEDFIRKTDKRRASYYNYYTDMRWGEAKNYDLCITTEEYPLGVYHPHQELHHIKKENIGLIEVMGLAVLPSRLKGEMEKLAQVLVTEGVDGVRRDEMIEKHADWAEEISKRNNITAENVHEVLQKEIGIVFAKVLEHAGVYKRNKDGKAAFERFIDYVNNK